MVIFEAEIDGPQRAFLIVENSLPKCFNLLEKLDNAEDFAARIEILEAAEVEFDYLTVRYHAERVAEYASDFASQIGFPPEYVKQINTAARFHDAGKLFMPHAVHDKDGRLTDTEHAVMKLHAQQGVALLGRNGSPFMLNVVNNHHEKYSGRGYHGVKGENIPLEARLTQIADVFDAVKSARSYKTEKSLGTTLRIMVEMQLGFGKLVQTPNGDYILGKEEKYSRPVEFDPFLIRQFISMHLDGHLLVYRHEKADPKNDDMPVLTSVSETISSDDRAFLNAFLKTSPDSDLKVGMSFKESLNCEGWTIGRDGLRTLRQKDSLGYVELVEVRNKFGHVTMKKHVDQGITRDMDSDFDNDKSAGASPRPPRF